MKRIAAIITFICTIQTGYSQNTFSTVIKNDKYLTLIDNAIFGGKDTVIKKYYKDGPVQSVGKYAIDANGKPSSFRIGKWTDFYSNGAIRSTGEYQISSFLDCGAGGLERVFYNYKIGEWIYLKQDSTVEAKGNYKTINARISTQCKGGDNLIFMTITENWYFLKPYDNSRMSDRIRYLSTSVEFENGYTIHYYYEIKQKKVIKF
jgi:hypothetical protein